MGKERALEGSLNWKEEPIIAISEADAVAGPSINVAKAIPVTPKTVAAFFKFSDELHSMGA